MENRNAEKNAFESIDSKNAEKRLSELGVKKKEIDANPQLLKLAMSADSHVLEHAVNVIRSR